MPSFEFEVFCAECGAGLCNRSDTGVTPGRGQPFVKVYPCEKCTQNTDAEAFNRGYAEAEREFKQ